MEKPHVEWLTRLQLDELRESIQCLPQSARVGKCAFDVAAAMTMLLLLSPLLVLDWIAIRVTSPGAGICSQARVSLNRRSKKLNRDRRQSHSSVPEGMDRREKHSYGNPLTICNFRTMRLNAEISGAPFAQDTDPRIMPIG